MAGDVVEDPAIEVAAHFALDVSGQSTARGLDEPDDKRGYVPSEQLPQGGLLGAAAAVGSEWGAGASRCLLEDDRSRQSMRVLAIACEGDGHGARPSASLAERLCYCNAIALLLHCYRHRVVSIRGRATRVGR